MLRSVDSIILVQPATAIDIEHISIRSDAIVLLAHYVGGVWTAFGAVMRVIPRVMRDAGYSAIAKIRYRIFGRRDACRIPTAEEKSRFID